MKIKDKRDFLGGIMLTGFGSAALILSLDYPMGTAFRMGPGYFPIILSALLIGIGIIVAGRSLKSGEVAIPRFAWRAILVSSASVVLFGLLINRGGLLLATAVMVVVSRLSRPEYSWVETVILAVLTSVCCAAVFYFGLKVQMPLLPVWG